MLNRIDPLITIADDDPDVQRILGAHLRSWGFRVHGVLDRTQLFQDLEHQLPMVLLLDLRLGSVDGLEVLAEVLRQYPGLPVIMLTAYGSIDHAVMAMKSGAQDFLTKPPDLRRMRQLLDDVVGEQTAGMGSTSRDAALDEFNIDGRIWGRSPAMQRVKALVASVAPTDATVLVLGETGTGKELIARAVHEQSARRAGPFVPVNVAALPRELAESELFGHEKGAFTGAAQTRLGCCEAASGGTLFLDEIGEMDLLLQAKLLRFLQERTITRVGASTSLVVDVRVVAATNRDLDEEVRQGRFREDLYFRLNVVPIQLPPLRERREDIPLLANRFLERFAHKYHRAARRFTAQALDLMVACDWPGNIRQMENLVERLVILSSDVEITVADLPAELLSPRAAAPGLLAAGAESPVAAGLLPPPPPQASPSGLRRIDEIEKQAICDALRQARGNVRATARLLGLSPATMYRKFKQYDISLEELQRDRRAADEAR